MTSVWEQLNRKWVKKNMRRSDVRAAYENLMIDDLQKCYSDETGDSVVPCKPDGETKTHITEDFESNWFLSNAYGLQASETFESLWFINNTFISDYDDEFEMGWFISNTYMNQKNENFEDVSWDE